VTAEEHNRTLATLYFVYGGIHGLSLVGLLLLVFSVQTATSGGQLFSPPVMTVGAAVFVVLVLVVGLLPLLVGFGLRKRKRWVKPLALALAVISMINMPIGTALGIYTIKFFRSEGGVRLYGGTTSTSSESDLEDAVERAKPLLRWSRRAKQER